MDALTTIPRSFGFSGEKMDGYHTNAGAHWIKTYTYDKFGEVTVDKFSDGSCVLCVMGKGYFFYEKHMAAAAFSDARGEAHHCNGINRALR
jgi:hypothetical protein